MKHLKISTWNIERLDTLLKPPTNDDQERKKAARLLAIARQIRAMNPDILCIQEGPPLERIDGFTHHVLADHYVPIKSDQARYDINGDEWIWFLVKPALAPLCHLQPTQVWDEFAGRKWPLRLWGAPETVEHEHYRHPQVMVLDWQDQRVEFIGLHLKTKVSWRDQQTLWENGGPDQEMFIRELICARMRLASEAANVRDYIEAKFRQAENPALFVLGDLNDGPGRDYFARHYLFFDLVSLLQGQVFSAQHGLTHALVDTPSHLRWSVQFENFVAPQQPAETLLDHILFSQSLGDGRLGLQAGQARVEHEIHEIVNAQNYKYAQTSNHRPVSLRVAVAEE